MTSPTFAKRDDSAARRQLVTVPLLRRQSIGVDYHVLTFEIPAGAEARPGQFLMIRGADWGDAPLLARPMSYLEGGSQPSLLLRSVGEGTRRMARAVPGECFQLVGPLGTGWRAPQPGRTPLLVAGGVGVAPLLFLARSLAAEGIRAVAAYGARSERDLPLAEELGKVADLHVVTEDGSRGTRGLVTSVLEALLGPNTEVFTCGPEPMMARVAELCAARALPCAASLETPMACGFGVCLGCAVPTTDGKYLYACCEGPCVDAHRIAWHQTARAVRASTSGRSEAS